jgi:hypothetical protein
VGEEAHGRASWDGAGMVWKTRGLAHGQELLGERMGVKTPPSHINTSQRWREVCQPARAGGRHTGDRDPADFAASTPWPHLEAWQATPLVWFPGLDQGPVCEEGLVAEFV